MRLSAINIRKLFVTLIAFVSLYSCHNKPSVLTAAKTNNHITSKLKTDSKSQNAKPFANTNCIVFPKTPAFLQLLKGADCATLPANCFDLLNHFHGTKPQDTLYFLSQLHHTKLTTIDSLETPNGQFDQMSDYSDASDSEDSKLRSYPAAIIQDSADFSIILVTVEESWYLRYQYICSFTKEGVLIDGFLAESAIGNEHWKAERATDIDKRMVMTISEWAQFADENEADYMLKVKYIFGKDGHLKKIYERLKLYGDYNKPGTKL